MNILIIGKGNVGTTLGNRFSESPNNTIKYAVQDAKEPDELLLENSGSWPDLIFLTVPFKALENILPELAKLPPSIVVDVTNPINADFSANELPDARSAGEMIAEQLSSHKVVKAFNTIGANIMADPKFATGKVWLPISSNHPEAAESVSQLAEAVGFEPFIYPSIAFAREQEAMAWLWIMKAAATGERGFALIAANRSNP